jgi:hypothetical protein
VWEWTNTMNKQSQVSSSVRASLKAGMTCALVVLAQLASPAFANERDQAKRLFDRIAGVPPTDLQLNQMEALIVGGNDLGAADVALQAHSFYNVTLKNFVTPWTNRDQTVFAPLNDYTATVIGMVRDNVAFNTALSADVLYTVQGVSPAVSATNNDHYEAAENQGIDLFTALQSVQQSTTYGIPAAATAGLITTRASSAAFFIDGTNRAMFRFTLMNHMCRDLEQVQDTTRPPDRIRQDVSRSPGGDSRIFLNNCIGCHSGMDPMAQAFAYYDFDETQNRLVYTEGTPNAKYFLNADNFKPGFITPNDAWENRWRAGPNVHLKWSSSRPGSGNGAKSLGDELANSRAFAKCQVQKAFKAMCFRAPDNDQDDALVEDITNRFMTGYNLKTVFAETAVACMGN